MSTALAVIPKARKYTADPTNKISTSAGGGMTVHSMTVKIGSSKNLVSKIVRDSKQSMYYQFGAIQPFNNVSATAINGTLVGGGSYALLNFNTLNVSSTGAFTQLMPLHVFDLTCVPNVNNATITNPTPATQLVFTGTCASAGVYPVSLVNHGNLSGRLADGVTTSTSWVVQKSQQTNTSIDSYPGPAAIHEWSQIKLFCYGAKQQSTRFKIQIVQIKDESYGPLEIAQGSDPSVTVFNASAARINFWQGMASASFKHPMATTSTDYKTNIKIIKEYDFIVDPTTLIEERPDVGHSKQVSIFVPMFRKSNYNSLSTGLDSNLSDQDNFTVENGLNECYLKPKARIYLIVQATNTLVTHPDSLPTVNMTPSYDLVIRNKFSQLS